MSLRSCFSIPRTAGIGYLNASSHEVNVFGSGASGGILGGVTVFPCVGNGYLAYSQPYNHLQFGQELKDPSPHLHARGRPQGSALILAFPRCPKVLGNLEPTRQGVELARYDGT